MDALAPLGWPLLISGVLAASAGFGVARRRRHEVKVSIGVAAVIAVIWFIAVADWLPPSWKAFWTDHSLTASSVVSGLGVFAAWIFVSERARKRRTAALYVNLRNWLSGESRLIAEWLTLVDQGPEGWPILRQRDIVADVGAGIAVQQQWVSSSFTVLLTRDASDEEDRLMRYFAVLRKHGAAASRNLARLQVYLSQWPSGSIPGDEIARGMWQAVSADLMNVQQDVRSFDEFLGRKAHEISTEFGGQRA